MEGYPKAWWTARRNGCVEWANQPVLRREGYGTHLSSIFDAVCGTMLEIRAINGDAQGPSVASTLLRKNQYAEEI